MDKTSILVWNYCPTEILMEIFKYLGQTELISCMAVSRKWRNIADYYAERSNMWRDVVEKKMVNIKENFQQKSTLGYRQLFFNSRMWYDVATANVKLKHVYDLKHVVRLHVYKDNLIVVCFNTVKYYDAESCTLIKDIHVACLDYQETDQLIVTVTCNVIHSAEPHFHLSIYSKVHDTTHEINGYHYRVQGNKCYVVGKNNVMFLVQSTAEDLEVVALARFYDSVHSIVAMQLYAGSLHVFLLNGAVFKLDDLNFLRKCYMKVPALKSSNGPEGTFKTLFHEHSAVYAADVQKSYVTQIDEDIHVTLLYPGLTCAVEHGDVLFLGFDNGKIGVVIVKDIAGTRNFKPALEFLLHEVVKERVAGRVRRLAAREAPGCHHLLVATATNLYQLVISLPDYAIVM